jgi:AGZA family xanthine/uracil permease-like MFS transporter
VPWDDPVVAVPAFLTLTTIPWSFSIANGLAVGFTSYAILKLVAGRGREVSWLVWLLTALFILRFAYLGKG